MLHADDFVACSIQEVPSVTDGQHFAIDSEENFSCRIADGPIPPTEWQHLLGDGQRNRMRQAVSRRHHHHCTTTSARWLLLLLPVALMWGLRSMLRRRRRRSSRRVVNNMRWVALIESIRALLPRWVVAHCCSLICKVYFQDFTTRRWWCSCSRRWVDSLLLFAKFFTKQKSYKQTDRQTEILSARAVPND